MNSIALPKHCLHVDNSFGIGHVIFLGTHRALLIHNHQIIGVYNTTLQQTVQTGKKAKEKKTQAYNKAIGNRLGGYYCTYLSMVPAM